MNRASVFGFAATLLSAAHAKAQDTRPPPQPPQQGAESATTSPAQALPPAPAGTALAPESPPAASTAPVAPGGPSRIPPPVMIPHPRPWAPPPPPLVPLAEDGRHGGPPLAGWHERFFIRDGRDNIRLYPMARLQVDLGSTFGPGAQDVAASDGGNALKTQLVLRRMRFEIGGQAFQNWSFVTGVEFASQAIANANGRNELSASKAGEDPTGSTARFAPVQATQSNASLTDNYINYRVIPELNLQLGQMQAPFGIENRTSDNYGSLFERSLAVRGFAVPTHREIGLMAWGEIGKRELNYEVGLFAGDGPNRPQVDNRLDFIGRVFALPFHAKDGDPFQKAQVGASLRYGSRDRDYVGYSYPAISTQQGFVLFDPKYKDSLGRTTHIIPAGKQLAVGGELRLPLSFAEVRSEVYYVSNDTREAIDGYQLSNTERLGNLSGVGYYALLSAWPLGDRFVTGDPGFSRTPSVNLEKKIGRISRGLEVFALVGGINAKYEGGSREELTHEAPSAQDIRILQYAVGTNYYFGKLVRVGLNYVIYHAPESGPKSTENMALVAGNLAKDTVDSAHVMHELSARVGMHF